VQRDRLRADHAGTRPDLKSLCEKRSLGQGFTDSWAEHKYAPPKYQKGLEYGCAKY